LTTSSEILSNIVYRLDLVRKEQNKANFLEQALLFCNGVVWIVLSLLIAEMCVGFSSLWRTILTILLTLTILTTFVWMVLRPLLKWLNLIPSMMDEDIAKIVGNAFPGIRDRLLNALQLSNKSQTLPNIYSEYLIDESLRSFARDIEHIDFSQSVYSSSIPVFRKWLFLLVAIIGVAFFLMPESFLSATHHFIHFNREFIPPQRYYFECTPGNKEIVKGEDVRIQFKVKERVPSIGFKPDELTIVRRQVDQKNIDVTKIKSDSSTSFNLDFPSIRITTEYYARYRESESDHYVLTVLDRPLVRSFRIKLNYPAYSHIPSKILDEFIGDVNALQGTQINLTGNASKPLREAHLHFGNNNSIPCAINGDKFSVSFPLTVDNSYHISLFDEEGLENREPVQYQLKIMIDDYPSVAIVEPGRNIDIAGDKSINLLLHAKDDYGFSSLRLGYRLIKSRYERPHADYSYLQIPFPTPAETEMEFPFAWDLTPLSLVPEDVVEYYAEIFDNDGFKGPKSARSPLFLLRLPSLDEVFADMNKSHEQSLDDLKESVEQSKKLREEIESITRDLKKNKDPDWQTQKKMMEMAQRYQQVQKKLDEVQSRLEQITQQMQQQNVLSNETMEKYIELQQLFQQMDATELQKALKQMQQQMPNISKEQLQQAMQNITFSEEQFRQSIERTLNLLKRIHIEQKIDEVKKRTKDLEKIEKELKEQSTQLPQNENEREKLSKRQADLAQKEQILEKETEELQRSMEEFFTEMPADQLQKSLEQLKQQQLHQKMQQAAKQIQSGDGRSAQQLQQQIEQQLQNFGSQLDEMQQQMLQKQAQYIINELRRVTSNLLELSKEEEVLKAQSQNAPQNSPQLRQNAQDQLSAVQNLQNVIKSLEELSNKSFAVTPEMGKAIGEALARMNNAMRSLDVRNGTQASQEQGQAMAALNRAAVQVQQILQSMMQGGGSGAGSLMQQLQMMASRQMALNLQTQEISGEMSQQQATQAARLAQEQAAIQKSLEELNREAHQSNDQQKILGDLQRIADEMKEVVRNLEQNTVNPETIQKQERILSRLLDASKSMRERDYEKKRKSETGTQIVRRSPKDIDVSSTEEKNRLQEELLKAMEQGFAKDYQELIRKYFEKLEHSNAQKN